MVRIHIYVSSELCLELMNEFPETQGFQSNTKLVDWCMRKLLALKAEGKLG